jgi:hypothetical protein
MTALAKHQEQAGQVVTHQDSAADAWLSMIERAARDPSVDVSKMERMFEMRERVMKTSAEQAFNVSFVAVRAAVGPVIKNKSNDQTRSKYADLFAIADVLDPIMTENGFAATFGTADCPLENHYRITGTLLHAQGHSKEYHVDVPVDGAGIKGQTNKTATHAFGSTMTYGRRYLKVAMFDISITDNDGNRRREPAPVHSSAGRGYSAPQNAGQREQSAEPISSASVNEDGEEVDQTTQPEWPILEAEMEAFSTREDLKAWWLSPEKKALKQARPHLMRAFYRFAYMPTFEQLGETVEWTDEAGARG